MTCENSTKGRGHTMHTATLTILGKPVMFTPPSAARVEACRKYRIGNRFPPGPCKKVLPDGAEEVTPGSTPKKTVPKAKAAPKKTTGKKAAPKKTAAPAETGAEREAQVKKMTGKPFHHGYRMAYVIDRLKKLANAMGGNFDRDKMIARVTTKHGTGEMRMTPQGWEVNIQRTNSAPYTRVFKDVESAAAQIESLRFFRPGDR